MTPSTASGPPPSEMEAKILPFSTGLNTRKAPKNISYFRFLVFAKGAVNKPPSLREGDHEVVEGVLISPQHQPPVCKLYFLENSAEVGAASAEQNADGAAVQEVGFGIHKALLVLLALRSEYRFEGVVESITYIL